MQFLKSNRLAWSVAAASLTLWVVGAPTSWGAHMLEQANAPTLTTTISVEDTQTPHTSDGSEQQGAACPTAAAQPVSSTPTATLGTTATSGSFHVCGADAQTAQAIEQLIGGRGFTSSLTSHGDGCADLTITTYPGASTGSTSSTVSVSVGGGRRLTISIASMQGVPHVTMSED